MLTSEEVREVLHCPWCNEALLAAVGPTFLVRTAEGVNLTFMALVNASDAAELLNLMARAKNRCARTRYERALEQYTDLMGLRDERIAQGADERGGVFELLNPHHDLSTLAEYAVPPFQGCGPHEAKAKGGLDKADRSTGRWSAR